MRGWKACAAWLVLSVGLLMFPGMARVAAAAVRMEVQAGFDGRVKPGTWAPLTVAIENDGPEMQGQLYWDHLPQNGPPATYKIRQSLAVTLPAGAKKRFTVYAPVDYGSARPAVRLMVKDQVLAESSVTLNQTADILIGVLGPEREDLAALATLRLPNGRASQLIKIDPAGLPDRVQALRNLDALIIADFSAAELTDEQRHAIRNWVEDGGMLILAGGPEASRTLTPWLPWVSLELKGQVRANLAPLGDLAGAPFSAEGDLSRAAVQGARVLASTGDLPLVATFDRGEGRVMYLAFDPTLAPVHGWGGAPHLWERLMQTAGWENQSIKGADRAMAFTQSLVRSAQMLPAGATPSLRALKLVFLAYVLLIGPVTFLVLRRLRRAEWAWVAVPVLVLLFSGGIWINSRTGSAAQVAGHQVSLVQLDGGETARVRTMLGVFLPADFRAEVAFAPQMPLEVAFPDSPFYGNRGPDLPVGIEIGGGGNGPARLSSLGLWTMRAVGGQTTVPAPGRIETEFTLNGSQLQGTVVNQTGIPLKDVLVSLGASFARIGNLDPGQGSEFTLTLAPAPGDVRPVEYALRRGYEPGGWGSGSATDEQILWFRRSGLLDAVSAMALDPSRPVVVAWADWSPSQVTINGQPFDPHKTAMFVQQSHYKLAPGAAFSLPAGVLEGRPVAFEGEGYGFGPSGWGVPERGSVTVEFDLPDGAATVEKLDLHVPIFEKFEGMDTALVSEFWDWQAREWRPFAMKDGVVSVTPAAPYIDPDHTVTVRIRRQGDRSFPTGSPTLAIAGKVR